jgi:hypothetical protein
VILAPRLTVVIVSPRGGPLLDETFAAVTGQAAPGEVEIVVAARRAAAERFHPDSSPITVRVMRMADEASIPELYAAGVQSARGTIVAVTNDRFVPRPDWIAAIVRAHDEHPRAGVIGGAVESSATDSVLDRAVYYCEYAQFATAIPAGPCRAPGPNVSYTGAARAELAPLLEEPTWELFWHQHLIRRGVTIERDPRIRVRHRGSRTLSGFLRERYLFSRSLAGERMRDATRARRIVRGLGSLMLPPVLLIRLLRRLVAAGDGRGRGLLTVPLLALFTIPWAWGEVVGSLWGAGETTRRIR